MSTSVMDNQTILRKPLSKIQLIDAARTALAHCAIQPTVDSSDFHMLAKLQVVFTNVIEAASNSVQTQQELEKVFNTTGVALGIWSSVEDAKSKSLADVERLMTRVFNGYLESQTKQIERAKSQLESLLKMKADAVEKSQGNASEKKTPNGKKSQEAITNDLAAATMQASSSHEMVSLEHKSEEIIQTLKGDHLRRLNDVITGIWMIKV